MSRLVLFFILVIPVLVPKNVAGNIVQDVDVEKLLDILQQRREASDTSSSDESDDANGNFKPLDDNLLHLLSRVVNRKNHKHSHVDRSERDEDSRGTNVANILDRILNNGLNDAEFKSPSNNKVSKKRFPPNRLLGNVNKRNEGDLQEYSKIYVLLNPQALQKSKSKKSEKINDLVSRILSLSSSPSNRDELTKKNQNLYKGFALMDRFGRRRNSREMYDSVEDKKSRLRSSGGGGSAGHTAIPYIRHRGDNIYEREN